MKDKLTLLIVFMLVIASAVVAVGVFYLISNNESTDFTPSSPIGPKRTDNGVILEQDLNEDFQGYTVMCLWGSYYEMGYAHAQLLADYIVVGVNEIKNLIGNEYYSSVKSSITNSLWIPSNIEDELDGMVDSLAITHPSANIDKLDLKLINTAGDWLYGYACRSHSCWGRYIAEPIKTLSTRRLDFDTFIPTLNHHLLCVYIPDDGSTEWMNFAFPGIVVSMTGVNEYGTLASIHDWSPMETPDVKSDRMSRLVAIRHALTYPTDDDLSTHLNSVYTELQNYECMSMSFLNYYVPEGYGGVMTCNPWQDGLDTYNLRLPQTVWHNGEAIITTNYQTDGTYTPYDEDFASYTYYSDETPKTLESHWDLLSFGYSYLNLHTLSVAYRGHSDMTIWADGRLDDVGRTPRFEYEWSDLFDSNIPSAPEISGPIYGDVGTLYDYDFTATDLDGDDIYYYIDWGDGTYEDWSGPYTYGATASHTWTTAGNYMITARARDTIGFISLDETLSVTIE